MRNFDSWLDSFCESIANYKYYINFDTVYANTDKFKIELNILNSLVGSTDIENDFRRLVEKYPECIKVIPLLLAKRESEIFCMDSCGAFVYSFNNKLLSSEQYIYFMKETGLFDLISGKIISNLYDYALGVNTGLDSNGRKNRGGHLMEDLCEEYVKAIGLPYGKEVCIKVLFAFDPILTRSNAFCNERDILAKCHHPNIIHCYCTRQTTLCRIIELEYSPSGSVLLPLRCNP